MFKLVTLFGILLVLAGASIVLRQLFHIDLPLARIAFGALLIWAGASVIARSAGYNVRGPVGGDEVVVFSDSAVQVGDRREVSVVFSSGVVDLARVPAASPPRRLEINTIFGSTTLLFDPKTPLRVTATSAFGQVALPDQAAVSFGERTWQSEGYDPAEPGLDLKVNAVFGSARFATRASEPGSQAAAPQAAVLER